MQLTDSIETRFLQGLDAARGARLGLAVSGGGDSMALLHLAVAAGSAVSVATVDHGLRAEAADEAAMVARACAALGVPHTVLHWRWDGRGNLPDAARRGRIAALAGWAAGQGIGTVCLGHTRDDVAETLLMRRDRSAGVDGLAAMQPLRQVGAIRFLRPLLAVGRAELRDWLSARGILWAEDATNTDDAYARARARKEIAATGGAEGLAAIAQGYATLRAALDACAAGWVARGVGIDRGDVLVAPDLLADAGPEALRRILQAALLYIASAEYGPRGAALTRLVATARAGRPAVLGGCVARPVKGGLRLTREWRAVAPTSVPAGQVWDGRWQVTGPEIKGLTLRALGPAGLALCPHWRETGLPRASLLSSPAVWAGADLVAAPLACPDPAWQARPLPPAGLLRHAALSH
ncbi:MAG: tRNA lysidine(34) synthetase TilS [Pseudomonadota bacterium]